MFLGNCQRRTQVTLFREHIKVVPDTPIFVQIRNLQQTNQLPFEYHLQWL